jgi:hypothetical protein
MTHEEIEAKLTYLLDRDAIRDVVTTYCRGVDRFDRDLMLSAYHADAEDDHAGFVGGAAELYDWVEAMHGTYHRVTQHYVANHLVEIDGTTAHAETYFIYAALNKAGAPFSLMGGRYVDRLEKRDGRWAIVARSMLAEWAAPAINTVEGSQTPEGGPNRANIAPFQFKVMETQVKPARGPDDPSYMRPLNIAPERRQRYEQLKQQADGE